MDELHSNLLSALSKADETNISKSFDVIKLKYSISDIQDCSVMSNCIFVRSFYKELFDRFMEEKKTVLLGNPGIGKSMFQYYLLWRLCKDKSEITDVVFRQLGPNLYMYLLRKKTAYIVRLTMGCTVQFFKGWSKTPIYLFDPQQEECAPFIKFAPICMYFLSVRRESKYHEYKKQEGFSRSLYMSPYTLQELVHIQKYAADPKFDEQLVCDRFNHIGGLIRYVFCSESMYVEYKAESQYTLQNLKESDVSCLELFKRVSAVTHHLMHLHSSYPFCYENVEEKFVNSNVKLAVFDFLQHVALANRIQDLQRNDSAPNGSYNKALDKTNFQAVVAELLCSSSRRDNWISKTITSCVGGEWAPLHFNKKLSMGPIMYEVPQFEHKMNFEVVDMMYRDNSGNAICIQATRQFNGKHKFKSPVYDNFLRKFAIPHNLCKIVLCPSPQHAENAKITKYPPDEYAVWKIT